MRRFPPFAPLIAFEVVARRLSFSRAAEELGLTQSAVSHRVRQLETWYGARLFLRDNPGIRLTVAGERLQRRVAVLLDALARLEPVDDRPPIRLAVGTAVLTWWLARRLPAFAASHPEIRLEVVPCDSAEVLSDAAADLRILWVGRDAAADTETERVLFRECVFPVCHPGLLPEGRPLDAPESLADLPLLHKGMPEHQGAEWNWLSWVGAAKAGANAPLYFAELGSALAAAAGGAGVALGRSLLVGDAIAEGQLVRALPRRFDRQSSKVHVLRWHGRSANAPAVARLADWLQMTARQSAEAAMAAA